MEHLILGFISCIGFGYLFNCSKSSIIKGSIAGALGWWVYQYCSGKGINPIISTFIGSLTLSIICEVYARVYKDAVTVFVLPAILPLVPGAGLYYTMLYYIQNNYSLASAKGIQTLGCAVAIATGLLIVSSISRFIFKILRLKTSIFKLK